jgi:hypothetical protein
VNRVKVAVMGDVERARQALTAAVGLPCVLAASWDAFDVLAAGCQHGERTSGAGDMFAPYAFAATAAAEGRAAITTAPSLPSAYPVATGDAEFFEANQEDLAVTLAGLARALHDRLAAAAADEAVAEADRTACADGAFQAALVQGLLAPGEQ